MGHAKTIDQNWGGAWGKDTRREYVTEALVRANGRAIGCPRCGGGLGNHNAECQRRIREILQQSRTKL